MSSSPGRQFHPVGAKPDQLSMVGSVIPAKGNVAARSSPLGMVVAVTIAVSGLGMKTTSWPYCGVVQDTPKCVGTELCGVRGTG